MSARSLAQAAGTDRARLLLEVKTAKRTNGADAALGKLRGGTAPALTDAPSAGSSSLGGCPHPSKRPHLDARCCTARARRPITTKSETTWGRQRFVPH